MSGTQRLMSLVGFLQAQNCTNMASSWRHPDGRTDFLSADYYRTIGRVLEAGKFDLGFFDDRLAMPDRYGNDHGHTVEHGIRCVKLDPTTVLMAMGMATERLGLGATCSTTYYEPFHVARLFATIDLMTDARAAWNIVTSVNDGEAWNMGRDEVTEHDKRYDRADEFLEVVLGHWDSWQDDALVVDKISGLFAHPEKVGRLDHVGEYFRSRGPFTVPRSAQGHPVLIQAGSSGRGKRFAARWAELVFVTYRDIPAGQRSYAEFKAAVAQHGRDPDHAKVATLVFPIAAATKAEAEDRMAVIESGFREIDALSLLSEALNFDFASKGLDDSFTTEELDGITGVAGQRQGQPDGARFHPLHRTRPGDASDRRRPEGDRRRNGSLVRRRRLRRLRDRRHAYPRQLRGFRPLRGARTATARNFPQRLHGGDAARPSRAAAAGSRRVADDAIGAARRHGPAWRFTSADTRHDRPAVRRRGSPDGGR
jgi:FMN-dependent oxidoreductase (nitrilotriacetate monooxygenase family)